MRLLMVEDDDLFGAALQKSLRREGYAVDWIQQGSDIIGAMRSTDYDCVLLDLNLRGDSGEPWLRVIRQRSAGISIIVVSARGGLLDRVRLLELGADDYLVKPVDLDEASARVRAVTRRSQQSKVGADVLSHGPLRLQPAQRTALWNEKVVPLTNREFWLLETLVRKKDEIVSRARLEETLYSWGKEIDSNAVEVYIHRLRRKFEPTLIKTVRGLGYRLAPQQAQQAQQAQP